MFYVKFYGYDSQKSNQTPLVIIIKKNLNRTIKNKRTAGPILKENNFHIVLNADITHTSLAVSHISQRVEIFYEKYSFMKYSFCFSMSYENRRKISLKSKYCISSYNTRDSNVVFYNDTLIWSLFKMIIPASLIWGNTVIAQPSVSTILAEKYLKKSG